MFAGGITITDKQLSSLSQYVEEEDQIVSREDVRLMSDTVYQMDIKVLFFSNSSHLECTFDISIRSI